MTEEKWIRLVSRLEDFARREPVRYRRRVALLALLGYGYLVGALALLLALTALVAVAAVTGHPILIKIAIPLGALALVVARSLWIRLPPPQGEELVRSAAPELSAALEELREKTGAPPLYRVLVTDELNAAIVQIPRFGFGGRRNYLLLGLPLMQALAPGEFRAVIAHEMGHLSASHGRFAAWIYRLRSTWARLLESLERARHAGSGMFRTFFRWYAPFFNAYSFALARAHEYEADRTAADAVSGGALSRALGRLELGSQYLSDSYWPALYRTAAERAEPPKAFAPLAQLLPAAGTCAQAERWLSEALRRPTDAADTHPALADRLRALGCETQARDALQAPEKTAAAYYLGALEQDLAHRFDEHWREAMDSPWRERHVALQAAKKRLAELTPSATEDTGGIPARRELATLTREVHGAEAAMPMYRALLDEAPDDPEANFVVGEALVTAGDEAGVAHLERSMAADDAAVLAACELAFVFYRARGDEARAAQYRDRALARDGILRVAAEERGEVGPDSPLILHELPPDLLEGLRRQLAGHRDLKKALLARKELTTLPDEDPVYVLGFVPRFSSLFPGSSRRSDELKRRLAAEVDVPFTLFVVNLHGSGYGGMRRRFKRLPAAQVLPEA